MAIVFVGYFHRASLQTAPHAPDDFDGVAILKPLHGAEPRLRHNLEGFFRQANSLDAEIVLGVQQSNDPAVLVVEDLKRDYPAVDAVMVRDERCHGGNRKISNLINIMLKVTKPIAVLSDSDIGVDDHYLAAVLSALAETGVGVVTCPYYGVGARGFWSELAAMGLSYQFLPSVLTGVGLGMASPCMGSTIALRRETLARIGGLEAFRDVLADDYAVGAAVRSLGLRSTLAPVLVSHTCGETSLGAVLAHELRWARTIRGVGALGHLGSLFTHPGPLALLAIVDLGPTRLTLALFFASLVLRLWLKFRIDHMVGRSLGSWWLLPMRDITSFFVFACSFVGRSVEWRGAKFHVTKDGALRPV
jgi:ceramide glucosyltransferase